MGLNLKRQLTWEKNKMKKKEQTIFGCIDVFNLAKTLSILDVISMFAIYFGCFVYLYIHAYPMTVLIQVISLCLAVFLWIIQFSAIHGIHSKQLGLIIFNCVFKFFLFFLCLVLFVIASYGYMMNFLYHSITAYERMIPLSFFGLCYYGFHAYLLLEISILLHYGQKKNSKTSLPYYHSNLTRFFRRVQLPSDNNSDQESFVNIDQNILQMNEPCDDHNPTQMNEDTQLHV